MKQTGEKLVKRIEIALVKKSTGTSIDGYIREDSGFYGVADVTFSRGAS